MNEGDVPTQLTYYAQWEENIYTLVLKRNVEDDLDDTQEVVELHYTDVYNLPGDLFENGDKIVQGWMVSEYGNTKYGPNEAVTMLSNENGGVVMLYAKWGRVRTVTWTFDSQGGSECDTIVMNRGKSMTSSSYQIPHRAGYSFQGWYTQPEGGEECSGS